MKRAVPSWAPLRSACGGTGSAERWVETATWRRVSRVGTMFFWEDLINKNTVGLSDISWKYPHIYVYIWLYIYVLYDYNVYEYNIYIHIQLALTFWFPWYLCSKLEFNEQSWAHDRRIYCWQLSLIWIQQSSATNKTGHVRDNKWAKKWIRSLHLPIWFSDVYPRKASRLRDDSRNDHRFLMTTDSLLVDFSIGKPAWDHCVFPSGATEKPVVSHGQFSGA